MNYYSWYDLLTDNWHQSCLRCSNERLTLVSEDDIDTNPPISMQNFCILVRIKLHDNTTVEMVGGRVPVVGVNDVHSVDFFNPVCAGSDYD